jgi:homoserine O-acetyltransferase/O-succinyltransferase
MADYETFEVRDLHLQSGVVLPKAHLAYKTYGKLSDARDNVIVYPTWFCGRHTENEWLIGEGLALDPGRYFIVIPNMMGNGLSISPSNAEGGVRHGNFPLVSVYDNVKLQHRLLTEVLGVKRIALAVGWSMGVNGPRNLLGYGRAIFPIGGVAISRPRDRQLHSWVVGRAA